MARIHTILSIIIAGAAGLVVFVLVAWTASLRSARPAELAWFWLSLVCVAISARLVYLTYCRFRLREAAGYNGVARRLTLGYLRLYGLLGLAALFAAAVGFMTLLTPTAGTDPATPLEVWAAGAARVINIPFLLAMMIMLVVLIGWSGWEEERLRVYFERDDGKEAKHDSAGKV